MKMDDSSATLTIVDAEHEDSGEYLVKVANSAGEVESVGILTVKGDDPESYLSKVVTKILLS